MSKIHLLARPLYIISVKHNQKMKRRIRIVTLVVWILSGAASTDTLKAQQDTPMTLHDCMQYAVSNATKMRLQAADRSDERWQRRQAILQVFTPSIDAQTYAYNQYGRNLDPETNTYNSVTTFHNGYSISASLTLFDGFRAINNMRMASTLTKMGLSKEQQAQDEICLATMEAYYNVLYYTELEKVLSDQVSTAKTARNKAVRQEELGQKGHADVLQMESELAQKEYLLINTTNQKNDALITLKDVMFWPTECPLQLSPLQLSPLRLPQGGGTCHERNNQFAGVALSPLGESEGAIPAAEIASLNVRHAKLDLQAARGAYSPKLSLHGGWSTTYYTYPGRADYKAQSFGDQFKNNAGEYVQLSLSIPIYDQFQRRTNLHLKKNALRRAQAEYDQTMRDIENEMARAVNDRDGAYAAFQQADKLATLQQEAFRLSTKQLENGLISAIEYQTASQTYLNAMAERVNALLLLKIKDAVVRYYQGEPYLSHE